MTTRGIIGKVGRRTAHEAPIGEDPDKRDYIVSNKKLYDTGFMPKFNLDYGVKELIKMYTIVTNRKYGNI